MSRLRRRLNSRWLRQPVTIVTPTGDVTYDDDGDPVLETDAVPAKAHISAQIGSELTGGDNQVTNRILVVLDCHLTGRSQVVIPNGPHAGTWAVVGDPKRPTSPDAPAVAAFTTAQLDRVT